MILTLLQEKIQECFDCVSAYGFAMFISAYLIQCYYTLYLKTWNIPLEISHFENTERQYL